MQINRTLYDEPYGTETVYRYQDGILKIDTQKNNELTTEAMIEESGQELKKENQESVEECLKLPKDKPKLFRYIFPPADLPDRSQNSESCTDESEQCKIKLKQTFEALGVSADIVDMLHGARFTRFEIQIGIGVRIRDVFNIEDDIKLTLGAADIHIEAPIPGKTTIGIDVENKNFSIVTFREMMESKAFKEHSSDLAV